MTELLAPNGKPSNLTAEQYQLVRTPEFKEWFGDWENDPKNASKVVDENGEPKVVARMDYERKYKYADEYPIFFCEKEDVKYFTEFGENEIYVFLNIKNPIIIQFGQSWDNVPYDELMKVFSEQDLTDMINYEWNENYKSWGEYLNSLHDSEQFLFSTDIISGHVKNKGLNDGVIIYDIDETSNHDVNTNDFIAFNSNQIKLADGTNTTFDGNNPDIRFDEGGEVIINPTEIECHNCHWHWKVKDGGDDLFICHKCYTDNSKYYKFEGLKGQKILDTISFKTGGESLSKTPAPKKERIYGSEKNKPESSKDTKSAEKIEFNEKTLETIKNKVAEHNENNPKKKVTLASAKAVVRRGMGAYSSTHRPTISGGKPNSRVAWGLARLNAFFFKIINGKSKSGKYSQDDDLINELGYKVAKFENGGDVQAYEDALNITFNDGGETKPKKVYVSIQFDSNIEKIPNTFNEYFTTYSEKTFEN
jgi:hypothetical protein